MKPCCQNPENLVEQPSDRPDLTIKKCKVCGCRHFEATADAGHFGILGGKLG